MASRGLLCVFSIPLPMFCEVYIPPPEDPSASLAEIAGGIPFLILWEDGFPRFLFLVKLLEDDAELLALLCNCIQRFPRNGCDYCWGRREIFRLFGVSNAPIEVVEAVRFFSDCYDFDA